MKAGFITFKGLKTVPSDSLLLDRPHLLEVPQSPKPVTPPEDQVFKHKNLARGHYGF